jgi:formylglycine-generating enzyme required for sulfatase activity
MPVRLDEWRDRLPAAFRDLGRRLRGEGVNYSVYAALVAAMLWPLIKLTLGQPGDTVKAIMEVLTGLGSNVTAGKIQAWLEQGPSEVDLSRTIGLELRQDPGLRTALDELIERLDAVRLAGLSLSPDDRVWFRDALRDELDRSGAGARFREALDLVVTGQGNSVSVVINQYPDGGSETDRTDLARAVSKYLYRVREEYGKLELRGIERQTVPGALALDKVYVSLEADLDPEPEARDKPAGGAPREARAIETRDLLAVGQRLAVVGGPGSGKSTVLLHIASVLADALYRDDPGHAKDELGISAVPMPVLVPLNGFGRFLRDFPKEDDQGECNLPGFISQYLRKRQMSLDLPPDFFQVLLRKGRSLILLLDGLDEVADEGERAVVSERIDDLLGNDPGLGAVVSCRAAAYKGRSVLREGFRVVHVRALDDGRVERLVRRYYGAMCPGDPGEGDRRSDDLLEQIQSLERQHAARVGKEAGRFIVSPLMVRMLLIVHYNDRRLPDQRAALYMKTVDTLLLPDYAPDAEVANDLSGTPELSKADHRQLLQALAFELHRRGQHQGREIPEHELKSALRPKFGEARVKAFIELTRTRGTVLEERLGDYRFAHLGYQEFLAARYLALDLMEEEGLKGVVRFFKAGPIVETWWREPALLFAGYFAIENPSTMRRFLDALGPNDAESLDPDVRLAAAEVSGTALLEWDRDDAGGQRAGFARRIQALFEDRDGMARSRPTLRARAGQTLAQLGDPRVEVADPDAMQFCLVPAGEFWLGSGDDDELAYGDEKAQGGPQRFDLDYDFWMARYPVTNAQFERFVKDRERTGYPTRDFGLPFTLPNHPVVGITWYEALDYCRWLTERWRGRGFIGDKQEVALPSEPEWEKAARGGLRVFRRGSAPTRPVRTGLKGVTWSEDELEPNEIPQRRYPWGPNPDHNLANYRDTGIGTTSAIGVFPGGASPYGCEEMSGNVWEWTRSLWTLYPYPERPKDVKKREALDASSGVSRVLRGGAFHLDDRYVRCAFRSGCGPDSHGWYLGVRVVVRPLL